MINAQLNFKSWEANTFNIKNAEICHAIHGHPNGANSYKIKVDNFNIVYATDLEHPEGKLNSNVVNLSKDADILIHDSHFSINDLTIQSNNTIVNYKFTSCLVSVITCYQRITPYN